MKIKTFLSASLLMILFFMSCKKEEKKDFSEQPFSPTPVTIEIPRGFPQMPIPADNPFTKEGIELGRHLFYENSLSGDNTMSCGSCHRPSAGFSDSNRFSVGIDNIRGVRQSMPIMNIAWANRYFWDGRAMTLEEQIIDPVENPIELHETWKNAMTKLQGIPKYREMFKKAFNIDEIDSLHATKALAQFMRTMISGESKFDQVARNLARLTPSEENGKALFETEAGADCFHCHAGILFTDFSIRNNGLNPTHTDNGFGNVTGNPADNGKFKAPSLRNLVFTAPYMHNGKFSTIDEVIDFYSSGLHASSPNIDIFMKKAPAGGVQLNILEKQDLKAFLLALTDSSFITNPDFQDPNGIIK
ncbi:MAG: cytochrome c peroxidase [Flavobacteriales bacterium]